MGDSGKKRGLFNMIRRLGLRIGDLKLRISLNRRTFVIYSILRGLVLLTLVRMIMTRSYEGAAICILSLILFLVPAAFEEHFRIKIPPLFEGTIYLFIYAAEIMGEINHYYVLIPGWDTILHTLNGFLCAALGFSMVYLMNRNSRNINLSPFYLTLVAFCFSMTVGVIWEFIEFGADYFLMVDMQKDFVISRLSSVSLDPAGMGRPFVIRDISETVIRTASGETYTIAGGYLDIGILDTMKDLLVNFAGAVVFSAIGYTALKSDRFTAITDKLIWRPVSSREHKEEEEEILKRKAMLQEIRRRKRKTDEKEQVR